MHPTGWYHHVSLIPSAGNSSNSSSSSNKVCSILEGLETVEPLDVSFPPDIFPPPIFRKDGHYLVYCACVNHGNSSLAPGTCEYLVGCVFRAYHISNHQISKDRIVVKKGACTTTEGQTRRDASCHRFSREKKTVDAQIATNRTLPGRVRTGASSYARSVQECTGEKLHNKHFVN